MKQKLLPILIALFPFLLHAQSFEPPKAEKIPFTTYIHKDTLVDNYYWLRDKHSAEVINYLYANNTYATNVMKSSSLLQKVLFEEFKNRRKENYDTKPTKVKNYYYYSRVSQDKQYPDIYRKKDSLNAQEKLVLNLNKLAEEFAYFNLGIQSFSPNQELLAYGIDAKGNNINRLFIKDVDLDSIYYTDTIPQVLDLLWSKDNKSFYYTIPEPKTLRSYRVYKHTLGTYYKTDPLIFEEPDKTYQLSIGRSASKEFILLNITKTKSSETWFWPDSNIVAPQLFQKRQANLLYSLNHFEGNEWHISTNYKAKNYQLMLAPIHSKNIQDWVSLVPPKKDVIFNDYSLLKDFLILNTTTNLENKISIINRKSGQVDTLMTNLSCGSIEYQFEDYEYYETKELKYTVQNHITPSTTYAYNLYTKEQKAIEKDTLLVKYNPNNYESKRLWAKAKDGTMVPMYVCYKKGIVLNGLNPTLLEGYGSYGANLPPTFYADNISYMDRGFIVATAHVRGGKELGEDWYENGKLMKKKNTFTDFIACAEFLIKEKYTSPKKLAISGGSAGGLLMGAVLNMRPDLFICAVANVPFVDVINTMLDETIPLTTFEFEEWGNPKIKADYAYMKSYSPYDNVSVQVYPNMLVTAGYNDAQVGYWEPAKWVSKLREYKTDSNLLLFQTTMDGGHGGSSGKYESMKEQAFKMAFIMRCLGVKENYLTIKGKVVDENNDPMVYTSIFIEGTAQGTSSNTNGEFELQVKDVANTVLVFQTMGYIKQKVKIDLNSRSSNLLVKMKSENIQLRAVVVNANAKDPAYAIIKEAIKRRKENADKIQSYATDVYMKSTVRLCEIPKKRPVFIPKSDMPDSNDLGLVYLSESVAKFYSQKPDYYKEQMLASKIAGEKQGFSWNRVNDVFFSLYEPSVNLDYYSDRPLVSPIAPLAMLNYKYKFIGSFYSDGIEINKIQVIPMRKGDPLFKGHIYITGNDYQVFGSELMLTKDAQIQFVDTVNLLQETMLVNNVWVPLKMQVSSYIKIFGFRAIDMSVASMSNFSLNKRFEPKFFGNETFKIEKLANKKDSLYWGSNRSIKLTEEEQLQYTKADSIYLAEHNPQYLDSMQREENKLGLGKIFLTGYSYSKYTDTSNTYWNFSPLLFSLGYNTVEGVYVDFRISKGLYEMDFNKNSYNALSLHYGVANTNFCAGLNGYKNLDPMHAFGIGYKIGRFINQYNDEDPINGLINAYYTLMQKDNFMKIYQKDEANTYIDYEVKNGLYTRASLAYFNRTAMVNHSNYSLVDSKKDFTSNNPLNPSIDNPAFVGHQGAEIGFSVRYVHKQKYESMPGYKNVLGSKYPELYANFKSGFGTTQIKYQYQFLELGLGKDLKLNALGVFKFDMNVGAFMFAKNLQFIDYKHFNGNQTIFLFNPQKQYNSAIDSRNRISGFHALDYYAFSTNQWFVETHLMHNFQGLVISKIPLIRRLKAREIVGINNLITPQVSYNELYFGLTNILNFFRIDVGTASNSTNPKQDWFYRVGVSININ